MWVRIKYRLLFGLCWIVGILPTWFLYHCLLDTIYFLMYKVAGYRVGVVRKNLSESFPEKSKEELHTIEKGFYYHLAEIFVDTIDMVSISRRELDKRITFKNVERHEAEVEGKDWIAALAHYGSWEYFAAYQFHTRSQVAGVYHPLHDKAFDMFFNRMRSRFGLEPVKMKGIMRYMVRNRNNPGRNTAVGLIADQNAPPLEKAMWFEFLNHKTVFFEGIERLALAFGIPVYYMHVAKTDRIRYAADFVMIYDGREEVREGEITHRYVTILENNIKEDPRFWMWSHRRWKYSHFYNGQRLRGRRPDDVD